MTAAAPNATARAAAGMAAAAPVAGEGRAGRQKCKGGDGRKVNHSHGADSRMEPF
ncbi:hypothetical protein GCM10007859_21300 [Brevundimonas denitrificans]|uniref:Uncharacterized protein n=1 Tax=Brevundimonas denitrificans TaxID=1443434 RepID=A0ABQ6BQM8_9CAUL|nr:hypothetical protein GCM10007859_21300 [Brevundimonas denitrificans]